MASGNRLGQGDSSAVVDQTVARGERLAKLLVGQLQGCSEDDLQKVKGIVEPRTISIGAETDGHTPSVEAWAVIWPNGRESLTYFTDDGELYWRDPDVLMSLDDEDDTPHISLPQFVSWHDKPYDPEAWEWKLRPAMDMMVVAVGRLAS
jgi:hypothetical protein